MSKRKLKLVPKDIWGECLHSALRKCCDSKISGAAWNLVYIANNAWNDYIQYLYYSLENEYEKTGNCPKALKKCSLKWHGWVGKHEHTCLYCLFELFSPEDWDGFSSYLTEKPKN